MFRILSYLIAFVLPASAASLLTNSGFETAPFPTGWTATGVVSVAGLNSTATAARLPFNTNASLTQNAAASAANFTADVSFQIAGFDQPQAFRFTITAGGSDAVEVRTTTNGVLQIKAGPDYLPLTRISDGGSFAAPVTTTVKLRIIGRGFGTAAAEYDVAWSDAGAGTLSHAATGLRSFASAAATTSAASGVGFVRNFTAGNSFIVDDVGLSDAAATPPAADYRVVPPLPDKVVNISGIYPHLAMSNSQDECGTGAVVPWAGKLWAITYGPHEPTGSDDKLYEIAPDLSRIIRPESIGGTPANRFIHTATNTLIIGPYFIDASGGIRKLSYATAPGRYTANAAHLTDPNRIYLFTMEDGLYDINVNNLADIVVRYPDVQGTGDNFVAGYHGKGAYTAQGRLIVANNGEPDQTYPSGVLATWDGTVRGAGDPNPARMTAWTQVFRSQHCEVTGPGGIQGNPNPATDPAWVTGFDQKSSVLRTYEAGVWRTWRLPKGSYTHDGAHGWFTEWPRIREISPGQWLMHMHGLFFNFPATFSSTNFAGLHPLCTYEKMPVDYCTFNGRLVMGKNDTSRFDNNLVPRAQSNLWFGQLSDLQKWGAPQGHGGVWLNENVAAGTVSEPFLLDGFSQVTLHLRHSGAAALGVEIQTSSGDGNWAPLRTATIPASGYTYELLNNAGISWVRLKTNGAATNLTAYFLVSNPYPHATPPSVAGDEFAALADIRDTRSFTDGLIRTVNDPGLPLELAAKRVNASGSAAASGYFRIGGPFTLNAVNNATAENSLRTTAATTQDFGSDAASAWVMFGTAKLRLPKLDSGYESQFASGWARGFREVVTERQLLNCQGTFYEVPRDLAGDRRRMRPIATHGKRITDFCSWRGLFVATGVLDSAPASDKVIRSADGNAALWVGEVDDLWRMGEPRGVGGPWLNTAVTANTPSDAYLMYGYDRKELRLSHTQGAPVNFTIEVDFLGDNTWSKFTTLAVGPGQTLTYVFPAGYLAHWIRVTSDTATTATAQFTYGPASVRDAFLDWSRDHGLPTGLGRAALAQLDDDRDQLPALSEFVLGTDPALPEVSPLHLRNGLAELVLRNLAAGDPISWTVYGSADLKTWVPRPDLEISGVDQAGVPAGFIRRRWTFDPAAGHYFLRLGVGIEATP